MHIRMALVVREHGTLVYPEGKACADVLISGEEGGIQAGKGFAGGALGMLYKFMMGGSGALSVWKAPPDWDPSWYPGATRAGGSTPEELSGGVITWQPVS